MPLLTGGRPALDLSGTTLVVGMGKSGLSAVRTLVRLGAEKIQVTDSRRDPPGLAALTDDYPAISCYTGEFRASLFAGADRIILSPGVSRHIPMIVEAAGRGIAVWGDVELFAQLAKAPVAAITGSNGKSTVTTLLGMMAQQAGLSVAVGGNLGTPPLELLERDDVQIYILELSSFQLETTYSLNARVASVLNISPDHMDRYAKVADYAGAKQRIFRGDGAMVLNADDPDVMAMEESHRRSIRFTLGEPDADGFGLCRRGGDDWLAYGDDCWLAAGELKIPGYHNVANALAALAMGQVLQLPRPAMLAALLEFRGLPHRSELITDSNGVRWFNDSKRYKCRSDNCRRSGITGSYCADCRRGWQRTGFCAATCGFSG